MRDTIQSFWVGPVSPLEQMCWSSFVTQGHPVEVYAYESLDVPDGVTMRDASLVVASTAVERFPTTAQFADYFRSMLLLRHGGWWVDADVYCLRPFQFEAPYVFAAQYSRRHQPEVTNCVLRAPIGSPLMASCVDSIESVDTRRASWTALGAALLVAAIAEHRLGAFVQPSETFCPLPYFKAPQNIFGAGTASVSLDGSLAVHLWNERRRRQGVDATSAVAGSFYARLLEAQSCMTSQS